jgi:carbon-monoxide dehydrogenase large subunit
MRSWVGRRLPRLEDPTILRGLGNYVADVAVDANLYATFIRSPIAAGKLKQASAPEGVQCYFARDIIAQPIRPVLNRPDYVAVEMPILAFDDIRFAGEPIAVVLASTQAESEDLAELVDFDIDVLAPVLDTQSASASGTRPVHDVDFPSDVNVVINSNIKTPNFDEVFAAADVVVEVEVISHRQSAMPLETRGSVASFDPRTGRTTLTTSTQMPHIVQLGICESLGIPVSELRVIAPDVGGAFGGKMSLAREDVALVALARKLRTSIAWIETRSENFLSSWHSREQVYRVEGAFKDGYLTALKADILADVGAYSCYPVTFGVEPLMAMAELPGPYNFAEYSVRSRAVITNKCPIAPYRGVSRPVQTLAMERLIETAAREMNMDPWELRDRNLIHEFPYRSPSGLVVDPGSYRESLRLAKKLSNVEEFRDRQVKAREQGKWIGMGISSFSERTGYGTPAFAARGMGITPGFERVSMKMDSSGGVELRIGASPHGQGLNTALAQLVADQLKIDPGDIRVIHGDTDSTPFGWGTFASRSMVICGGATQLAANDMRDQILNVAGAMLEISPRDLILEDGEVRVVGSPVSVPIAEIARTAYLSSHLLPEGSAGLYSTGEYDPAGTFSDACHVVEVEVDIETGGVEIVKYLVVEDAGILINPAIVDGQIHGGVAQGIANALYEELVYDSQGNLLSTTFLDYLPPTMAEIPHIDIHHLETHTDASLTGAKGVGEGGTIGAPAAILNAITDALSPFGISINEMPATPSRLRDKIRTAQEVMQ